MTQRGQQGLAFLIGVISLALMFWLGFIVWWWLMSILFTKGDYFSAILVAYSLPTLYTLVAYLASKGKNTYIKMTPFLSFAIITIVYFLIAITMGESLPKNYGAYLGMAFIASVMALMQYPKAGLKNYEVYKTTLFIGGVIFMPLFIYFAAMLPNVPHTPAIDKVILFPIGMLGFWLSGAWLISRYTQGRYVPGLEIKPLMPFRPDFILPGGVTYVKGVIMMGVGLMIMIHPELGMPKWEWWGFVLAFWGIIILIPLRGMYKLVKGRRLRMLGKGGLGFATELSKSLILFIGLNILLYGFVNAFFGAVPFMELGVKLEYNSFLSNPPTAWFGLAMFILSLIILILIRSWHKVRLLEGIETTAQVVNKQILLYVGTLFLLIAYIHLLYLPPIRELGIMWFYPNSNPLGFTAGLILFLAGSILILIFRPIALRNELEATMVTMVGVISDSSKPVRNWVMEKRIETLASLSEKQRDKQVRLMLTGLNDLPKEKKKLMMETQIGILSTLQPKKRKRMMRSMDKAMFSGGG